LGDIVSYEKNEEVAEPSSSIIPTSPGHMGRILRFLIDGIEANDFKG